MTPRDARDREGLVARIRQVRRATADAREANRPAPTGPERTPLEALEARVLHLEHMVEGLQDAVHRESERQLKMISEIQAQIEPAAMNAALSKDARERGLS